MELTASHAIQGVMVLATVAGGYAVVKSNLARVMEDLENHIKQTEDNRAKFDTRLDDAESERMTFATQINTLRGINSPGELKTINREMGAINEKLRNLEKQIDKLQSMHNGKHP
tara:strand:- start:820 stop:1161 length:342 start_codon:yes stop_codon:yes gene_type:complete